MIQNIVIHTYGEVFCINVVSQAFSNTTGHANWYNFLTGSFAKMCQSLNGVLVLLPSNSLSKDLPPKKTEMHKRYKY